MNRACASCGLWNCDGVECYLADPSDEPEEVAAPRVKYVRSLEYAAWCAAIDAARTTVTHSDPLLKRGVA